MSAGSSHVLDIAVLGRLEIGYNGESLLESLPLKGQALLVYLALSARPLPRATLAGLFWPEMPEESARSNLRLTLSRLRRQLPAGCLDARRQTIAFNRSYPHRIDADGLQALASRPQAVDEEKLDAVLHGVRGDFLQDFELPDAPEFEQWVLARRQHYHQLALDAYTYLLQTTRQRRDYVTGIQLARRLLALEPWHEEGHRQLMWLLAVSGQRSAALAQYESCRRLLLQELDVEPGSETVDLYEQIRDDRLSVPPPTAVVSSDVGSARTIPESGATGAAGAKDARPSLPPQRTPFVGRQVEIALLWDRVLDPDYRLITIVGEGGAGKTRLALALANRVEQHAAGAFADGVYFVPLAEQRDSEVEAGSLESRLVVACGAALGLNFATAQEPRVQLLNYLRHKNCLLIIDNFESILPAAPFLINILDSAPQITLLVTTRLPLNLQAEYLYRLPGMSVPAEALPQDIAAYDSLLLFQERAERAAGRPIPVDRELPHIVQICRSVEGLPLGIELAASWMRWHTPGEIVTLLQENLEAGDLVTQTPGDLPPRHHSLRTVFDHSWQLLQPEARRVLAQLSQFRGPFSAEAGLFVTQSTRAELAALVDSSLLQRSLEGYYQLHGLVRRFAAGKLVELDLDSLLLHERLMTYYMAFAGDLSPALNGENPRAALQRVQAELDNVLYAWQLATAAPHPSQLARGLSGMVDYWGIRGLFRQAQDALAQTLHRLQEAAPDATAELMARLLVEYAGMLFEVGNYDQAKQAAQQGIALAEQAHLAHVVPGAHLALGRAHWGQGQFENAREHLEHALQAVREAGDAALEAVILRNLAAVSWRGGNLSSARALCEEAQSLNRRLRNVRNESKDLLLLGIIADNEHRHDEAHATFERVLQLGQQSGDRRVIVSAYAEIGLTASHQGRLDRALHYLQMNLAMVRETGSFWHEGVTLSNLGDLRLKLGDFAGAESAYRGALDLARQANSLVLESNILSFWSLLDHFRECYDAGIDRARQSLQLAQQIDVPRETAFARQFLAHNLLASGDPEAAREHYQEARPIWLSLQDRARALESLTGLARVARARGDEAAVHEQVGALYSHLQNGDLQGADDPARVYLTCYEHFAAHGDPRAQSILRLAASYLQERAAQISNAAMRHAFLENIPSNAYLRRLTHTTPSASPQI